jgi:hypothetical protein
MELDIRGRVQCPDEFIERPLGVVGRTQGVVEGIGHRPGRSLGRLVLAGELAGRKNVQQGAAHEQRCDEHRPERKKQLRAEGEPLPH